MQNKINLLRNAIYIYLIVLFEDFNYFLYYYY